MRLIAGQRSWVVLVRVPCGWSVYFVLIFSSEGPGLVLETSEHKTAARGSLIDAGGAHAWRCLEVVDWIGARLETVRCRPAQSAHLQDCWCACFGLDRVVSLHGSLGAFQWFRSAVVTRECGMQ